MYKFLQAKHWQLFVLMFGLPIVFDIILFAHVFGTMASGDPTAMFDIFKFFPIMMLLFVGVMFGWFWAVAIKLQPLLPIDIKMKTKKFKILFFIPLVYVALILVFISFATNLANDRGLIAGGASIDVMGSAFALIVPLHLFSMFGIFYCLYFVAKTLKTVELQRMVTFSDFAGEFFLIWFFPIGIWIIQPRINKLANSISPHY